MSVLTAMTHVGNVNLRPYSGIADMMKLSLGTL
jgi:hypothetical protein